jgi:hypothetical protein
MAAAWAVALCTAVKPSNSIVAILPLKRERRNKNVDGKENVNRKDAESEKN